MSKLPKKIAVIGLGLIGGSIFMGLKKKLDQKSDIVGIGRKDKLQVNSDLIIIATPISEILDILTRLDEQLEKNTLVIDVGSTKEIICNHAGNLKNKNLVFVGTHPMAGREVSGFANSDPNIFVNKSWVVCPDPKINKKHIDVVFRIIRILGGRPVLMGPSQHDKLVSMASSLSLVTGSLLVKTVSSKDWEMIARLTSTGFRDTTRLASFDAKIKTEIVSTNKNNLLHVLSDFEKEIQFIKTLIKKENWKLIEKYFEESKQTRDKWLVNYFS